MHAFPLDRSMFEPQNKGLSDSLRLITFDSPGVGNSEAGPVTMEEIANLGVAILDSLDIDKAVVGGVSMGGYAAFALERRYPERLLGILLANTKPAGDAEKAKTGRRELVTVAREQGAAAIADRMLPKLRVKRRIVRDPPLSSAFAQSSSQLLLKRSPTCLMPSPGGPTPQIGSPGSPFLR